MIEKGNSVSIALKGTETFGARLKELIGEQSVKSFGDRVGISESGLRKCLPPKTSKPAFDKVVAIADEMGVQLEWLCTGLGPKFADSVMEDVSLSEDENKVHALTGAPCISTVVSELDEELVLIPGYHVQYPSECDDLSKQTVRRHLAFRRRYLEYRGLDEVNLVVVFNKGDAMESTIKDNDSLLVDISKTTLLDGKIFVVKLGNELYAKRIQKSYDGSVLIISDNKEYQPLTIPADKVGALVVLGQVVNVSTDL
ncbi:LexA family transcriptional regulator [Thaumasiovibrio subtropicus]|uniref:LexA family transcriptional regulator n=1 Tax=Thaumasiovibrio subtropicus TaxID=1891207 RepID=UPI000B3642E9|nr:LexA family transcriptional regulator [Thaumasiovibrio subtropicus]